MGRGAPILWVLTVSQGHVLICEAPRESGVFFSRKGGPSGGKELGTVFAQGMERGREQLLGSLACS